MKDAIDGVENPIKQAVNGLPFAAARAVDGEFASGASLEGDMESVREPVQDLA